MKARVNKAKHKEKFECYKSPYNATRKKQDLA